MSDHAARPWWATLIAENAKAILGLLGAVLTALGAAAADDGLNLAGTLTALGGAIVTGGVVYQVRNQAAELVDDVGDLAD